jgi:hypothetical protein
MAIKATYANATARLAADMDPVYDRGRIALQLDTNTLYRCIRGGIGADAWEVQYVLDDLTNSLPISLNSFREVDTNTDVGAIVANGGLLASDTTPALEGDAAESWDIRWIAGNSDIISAHVPLPDNFDGIQDVTIQMTLLSGATDAATFTCETGWDGGALVSTSVSDAATKSATVHTITATIPNASIPDTAKNLTLTLTPAAHATNPIVLYRVNLLYERLRTA